MKNSIFDKFNSLSGCKFVGLNGYTAKGSGELANFVINVGINEKNMKVNDLNKLKALNESDFQLIADTKKIALDIVKLGFDELVASAEKNLSENLEDRTAQSTAQTEAYIHICKGIKINKETRQLYLSGLEQSKDVILSGTYKVVNSAPKTIAKKELQKAAKLSCLKYRNFVFENADVLKLSGETIIL